MNLGSLGFLVCLCLGVMVFHLTPWLSLRRLLLTGINLGFLALVFHFSPWLFLRGALQTGIYQAFLAQFLPNRQYWMGMAVVLGGSYLGLRCLKPRPFRSALTLFILVCVIAFAWIKQYSFIEVYAFLMGWTAGGWMSGLELVGLSYMLFRMIHMAVDQWQDQLEPYSWVSYLNYQINFLALTAGPIQRYNDFHRFWIDAGPMPRTTQDDLLSWNRIVAGTIKMGVIAPAIQSAFLWAGSNSDSGAVDPLRRLVQEFYGYPLYLYFNFSGYTDIAVASAQLLGMKLPENFNRPFMARNIIDFWNRWHISLTTWIRDYVFMTSYKAAAERFPGAARQIGYGLIFLSLCVVGIWHGTAPGFAIFGAIHGLVAAVGQAYGDFLRRRLGPEGFKRYLQNPVIHVAAILLNFHVVCFSFLFFSLDLTGAAALLEKVFSNAWTAFPWDWVRTLVPVLGAAAVGLWIIGTQRALLQRIGRACRNFMLQPSRLYLLLIAQTVLVTLWLVVAWATQQPEVVVVYKRF